MNGEREPALWVILLVVALGWVSYLASYLWSWNEPPH